MKITHMKRILILTTVLSLAVAASTTASAEGPNRQPQVLGPAEASALDVVARAATSRVCVAAQEPKAPSGADRSHLRAATGLFSARVYRITLTLDADLDGITGNQFPISIGRVRGVPKRLARQARRLAGADGIALFTANTVVLQNGNRLQGAAARTALANADTATLGARLLRPGSWGQDEDGARIPTLRTIRAKITD
jgi:hypothetical protein